MGTLMDSIPHFAWPIRLAGGAYATVEQDTDAELMATVAVIVSFERGYRPEDPGFGITDPTLQISPVDTDEIVDAISEYEPRAEIDVSVVTSADPPTDRVRIDVRQATGAEE